MRFIALDLETTWLSPETDTIIEVAAVAFDIIKNDDWKYEATNIVEHSQLVYPGRAMTEEISMITGITDAMLSLKPVWWDVCGRVTEFIGTESVIVGHNVLFDIAMLGTHGIDITQYPTLDTFELSEILSQEAESLNLGYLAGLYGLSAWDKEHRALWDTRLSVGLFVHYINQVQELEESKKSIFKLASQCEQVKNLGLLTEILGWQRMWEDLEPILTKALEQDSWIPWFLKSKWHTSSITYSLTSLPIGRASEWEFLRENIQKWTKVSIGVFWHAQTAYMQTLIIELGYTPQIYHAPDEYCSMKELEERINRGNWKRKEWILIAKLLYWIMNTKTWLLKELKLYGEEREEIAFFRMQSGESNKYYRDLQISLDIVDVIIYDLTKHLTSIHTDDISNLILKDITLLEEAMRRNLSIHISIEHLVKSLWQLWDTERLIERIRFIEAMYLEFPTRPTWPEVSPPGGYGETYFLTQSDIWHRGWVSLSLVTNSLLETYREWQDKRIIETRKDHLLTHLIDRSIEWLLMFHRIESSLWAIIEIQNNNLTVSLIPREVQKDISKLLSWYNNVILYGTWLWWSKIHEFLKNEAWIIGNIGNTSVIQEDKHIKVNPYIQKELTKSWDIGGTVILTTSAKHIRELGKSLEKTWFKILMQGISWGKWKQLGLFKNNPTWTILIGTIDMWREEIELWNNAKHIILAKLPFDPPTDTYFLARTVGMKNNFSFYSEPMTIIKLNLLLSRIYSSRYNWKVYCEDTRLDETIWGRDIMKEIL